ncbi:MAG TPA: DUF6531 domain-containing protein, partial [Candidatus Baltobacteraceae bacterium]|nr:DUF6531 domain-containing protein [Candidatus Baltobacteraceae bacterium]
MRRRLGVFVVTLLSLGFAAPSLAATVYPNTGSFFLDFTDMPKTSGTGQNMIVERVYNSTTYTRGIFGTGWGSWFEERLEVRDDGALVVHEWGSGASNVFTPTPPATTRSKDAILAEVMTAAEKTGEFGSESDRTAYRAWAADRVDLEWERFREYGLVKPPEIPVGATFTSSRFGNQVITRVAEGYQRES